MVNPAYRLLLGMIVLLSGVGFRSAQAQYGPAGSAPASPGAVFSQASYGPGQHGPMNYGPAPVEYQTVDQFQSDYYGPAEQSDMITRALPVDRGWAYDHPMDGRFENLVHNSWMRLEYLLWKAPPGNQLIGTETTSGNDPRNPYSTTDPDGNIFSTKEADLSSIGANGTNGIRGTFGIDFKGGTFEAIFFGTKSDVSSVSYGPTDLLGPAFGQTDMISIQTFLDGQLAASTGRNFNQMFSATYKSQAWGVESNYVLNTERFFFRTYSGVGGLQIRPLVGFRYLKIGEEMNIRGAFEDQTLAVPIDLFESTVNSTTNNKLYVPQAGIRMEFVHPWFTISAQPKVGFGLNNYEGSVLTNQFLNANDPTHVTHISKRSFSPTFEFGLNARVNVSENITLNVGYNFLWATHIARPDSIIYYNTSTTNSVSGTSLQAQNSLDSYKLHGLVLGGEIRLP